MPIDRCYCREILFKELLARAERDGLDADALVEATGAGTGCGLCRSYMRVVLATGRTSLPVLSEEDVERLCSEAARGSPDGGAAPVRSGVEP